MCFILYFLQSLQTLCCLYFVIFTFILRIFLVGVRCISAPERSIPFSATTVLFISGYPDVSPCDLLEACIIPTISHTLSIQKRVIDVSGWLVNLWPPSWRPLFKSRKGFSIYIAVYARRVRVTGGSKSHLTPGTMYPCWNLTGT